MSRSPALPAAEATSALLWRIGILIGGLLLGFFALSCAGVDLSTAPERVERSADYAVYDAVLDSLFGERAAGEAAPLFVIDDSTTVGSRISPLTRQYLQAELGPLDGPRIDAAFADFIARSSTRLALDASAFRAAGRVVLYPDATPIVRDGASPDEFWNAFYARYPGARGSISFSRPGYDASGTHAVLAYGHGCGGLCGDWGYVVLERRGDRWVVLRQIVTTVS